MTGYKEKLKRKINNMIISLGCDHAGFDVKEKVKKHLIDKFNYEILDCGTNSPQSVDYPEYGHLVGKSIISKQSNRGIVICGSGIGISIAANKIKGIRAALCTTVDHAEMSRKHNDSNILAVGARMTKFKKILDIIDIWLKTDFQGGRHLDRVRKIEDIK